jgi:hypothetical protein
MGQHEDDLLAFEQLRAFDTALADALCAASASRDPRVLAVLRIGAMRPFAEFYFMLRARAVRTASDLAQLAEAHNGDLGRRIEILRLGHPSGSKERRLIEAIFTGDVRPRLLATWREQPGAIDQSNLGRFLAPSMSSETARKLALACERAGFLARRRTPLGTMAVHSLGVMEDVYGDCLDRLRAALAAAPQPQS